MDPQRLTAATFAPLLETAFRVTGPGNEALELRLTSVDDLPAQPNAPRPEPFSLVFAGPREPLLVQRTYQLLHDALGHLEIFLVPIGYAPEGGLLYEAVFN